MSKFDLSIDLLRFYIPTLFSIAFRAFGLGYSTKKRLVLGIGIYMIYAVCAPAMLISAVGYEGFSYIAAPVMMLGGFVVLIFSTDTLDKTIFLQLVQGGMTTALAALLSMIRTVFELSVIMQVLLLVFISDILYLIALRFWVKPLRFIADNIQGDPFSVLVLPALAMVLINLVPLYPPGQFHKHPYFCTGIMLTMELCFFLYVYILYSNLNKINTLSRQKLKNELLQTEVTSYRTFLETARQNRHDLRHHDALILEQLEAGDIEGAKAYLLAHDKAMKEGGLKQFCHNTTANAVLRLYERRALEEEVTFSAVADIPEELPLTAPEVGSLLGNLLENAINACRQCTDMNPYIIFTAEIEDDSLLLEVRNTSLPGIEFENGFPVSGKTIGGVGTRSIADTVKRYGGMVEFSQEESEFAARIILPMNCNLWQIM